MNMIWRLWISSFASVFLFFGPPVVWAASITWTNSSGGNWNVADNWSPNQVPGAADIALINTPGTYVVNVNASADVASLTVGGAAGAQTLQVNNTTLTATNAAINGTLTVTNSSLYGAITVNSGGALDVFGGTLEPTNSLTVKGGGVLNVTASTFYLESPLTNAGTINLTNATLYIYNNNGVNWDGGIDNQGVMNFYGASGDSITSYGGGYEYLINGGTINEQAGTGTSSIQPSFTNYGTVNAPSGILNFNGSFTTVGGTLSFGVSNLTSFGQIKILGTVALNGTASVTWLGGFVPAIGNSFALLSYGSYSGSFADITLPPGTLGNGVYSNTVFSLLITGINAQTNPPALSIESVNASTVVILWPTAPGNFTLQTSTNLSSGSWSNITSGITTVGADYEFTNTVNGKAAFFRLK
jgi:hypothetical protein